MCLENQIHKEAALVGLLISRAPCFPLNMDQTVMIWQTTLSFSSVI